MTQYVTGETIKSLRENKKLTQRQLAEKLAVSDKAVSKWETGRGLPDITLIEPLAKALDVSVSELLTGECAVNRNRAANMKKARFYVCPVCGNVMFSAGEGAYSCCGVMLPPLEAEEPDAEHEITVEKIDGEWFAAAAHPMEREHFISFAALVTTDTVQLTKLYPQQEAEVRFRICGDGTLYYFCNRHGLFSKKIQ